MATKLRKYIIAGLGFLMLPGANTAIANEGEANENTEILTDELAEDILFKYPSYNKLVIINPAWQALQDQLAAETEGQKEPKEGDEETDAEKDTLIESLMAELKEQKAQNGTLKGQLTKVTNERDKLKKTSEPVPPATPASVTTTTGGDVVSRPGPEPDATAVNEVPVSSDPANPAAPTIPTE